MNQRTLLFLALSAFDLSFGNSGVQLLRSPLQTLAERKAYDSDLEIVPAATARNSHPHLVTPAPRSQVEVTVTKQDAPVQDAPVNLTRDSSPPPVQVRHIRTMYHLLTTYSTIFY